MPDDTRLSRVNYFGGPVQLWELARSAMLSISAFRAKFGLRVIWLSAVRA
jgi:hypothetical protein